jgi:hypothetical protein
MITLRWSTFLALIIGLVAETAVSAPGDVLREWPIPVSTLGLTFDGEYLYYTRGLDAGNVYVLDPRTGASSPIIRVEDASGNPLFMGGLAYDPNRRAIWAFANNGLGLEGMWLFSRESGAVLRRINIRGTGVAAAYDHWRDQLWGGFQSGQPSCYDMDGRTLQLGAFESRGLEFDGVDVWRTSSNLPPPAPVGSPSLYPCDPVTDIDWSRLVPLVDAGFWDIAYDCKTFTVPAVWVNYNDGLRHGLQAIEVSSRAPCLEPGDRLLRGRVAEGEQRTSRLPLDTATADGAYRAPAPFLFRDPGALLDLNHPLVFYRLLGPLDEERGNVLHLIKDLIPFPPEVVIIKQ